MPTKWKKKSAADTETAALLHQHVVIAPLSVSEEHHQSYNSLELPAIAIFLYIILTLNLVCELLTIITSRSVTPLFGWSKQPKFLSSVFVHCNFWMLEFTIHFSCNTKFQNIILLWSKNDACWEGEKQRMELSCRWTFQDDKTMTKTEYL